MSDPTPASQQPAGTSAGTENTDLPAQEHMIPKSRFDEVNTALKQLQDWKAKQEAEARKAADKAAADKGEWERLAKEREAERNALASQHETAQARAEALSTAMEAQIKARVRALPEELRDMIPVDADVLTRYELVGKAEIAAAKLAPAQPRQPHGTPPGGRLGTGSAPSAPDLVARKRASGEYTL